MSLPGNGTTLATHADRRRLFVEAGRLVVDLCQRWYEQDDATALPRGIATFAAFENAMTLDIAMGGSTNTVLHLLAAAHEGGVDFTMSDIDRLSRRVPVLCKVAPAVADVHVEDVHRAGGVFSILGELDRAGLIHADVATVHSATLGAGLDRWDIMRSDSDSVRSFFRAAPGGVPTQIAFSQSSRWDALDTDRSARRDPLGGARLLGRWRARGADRQSGAGWLHREDGRRRCVDPAFRRARPRVREPGQRGGGHPGRPRGARRGSADPLRGAAWGPGMQEMLYPTSYLKSKKLGKLCALVTDGRFSGGSSGLSIGHVSPEAAEGGAIGLVRDGDRIEIDIPARSIRLAVDDAELARRRAEQDAKGWHPARPRARQVSQALRAYAAFATSAARGAVREVPPIGSR